MMLVKEPNQIAVRLPVTLRLWLELQATEANVPTSTLVRQWIAERAKQDLLKSGELEGEAI